MKYSLFGLIEGVMVLAFLASATFASSNSVKTGDGLAMAFTGNGQITGFSADGAELLSPGKKGGFFLGEYKLNPGSSILNNGGFEEPVELRMSGGWHRDTTVARSGKASLCLDVPNKGELIIQAPLKPDTTYMITFYMKTENLDGKPILHIRRLDAQGGYILQQANIEYLGIYYPDWVRCQHTFQALPGTARGELMFHVVYGKLLGKVWIDDLSICELPMPKPIALEGEVTSTDQGLHLQCERDGIQMGAFVSGLEDRISITGVLSDTTGEDRCVQLTYRLPVAAEGWRWYTGLDSFQTIEPGGFYTSVTEIGRDTNRYVSPWPYSSIDGLEVGLSLAVPMDSPAVYKMWYDEQGYYNIRMDFGLTRETRKFPSQAEFELILSRHDPRWGMRGAAKKYFDMFPYLFQVRTKPGAVFSNQLIQQVDGLEDFGAMYADRHFGDVQWIKSANDAGMYSMTYSEPWMWRSNFGRLDQPLLPTAGEIIERERKDMDVWDKNDSHDYWEVPRAYSVSAFINSVFHDEFGKPVMNGTRTYGGGRNRVVEWLTNADPDITGPNRGMLSWKYEYGSDVEGVKELSGIANGIRYDSLGEWTHQGAENFRREHFATADFPLTFSYRAGIPCQLGYFCALEYMSFVRIELLKRDGITYANGATGVPWFTWLLDGIFRETWRTDAEEHQSIRMLMYQKNCGDWRKVRMDMSEQEIESILNSCLTYAWWPGVSGTPEQFDQKRHIFRRYIPVLRSLSQAGWEPITYANAEPAGTIIERFGGEGDRQLFFTIRNTSQENQLTEAKIDTKPLGLTAESLVCDTLNTNIPIIRSEYDKTGKLSLSLEIPAGTTVVLEVKPASASTSR